MTDRSLVTATAAEVEAFLDKVRQAPSHGGTGRGRLIFALDATASRQPSWDRAAAVQGQMFIEADRLGGLEVQLVYYRGFAECRASRWVDRPAELVRLMAGVMCRAGETQIGRVLRHALKQATERRVHAVVFVGDACEEGVDELGRIAGELALRGVKVFLFREGEDPKAAMAFGQIAELTGGAHCRFDGGSPEQLRQLLGAVAAYAAGGRKALLACAERAGGQVRLLARQVR
ncbi:MAG TPA: VWA domain-containing protein [Geminicoccaceae bacterium]|nr:VWA domain-containing protein [Geminicoccus sp.]HMU48281.1 VWA domain-containing protein [Geminicoccaceae bacterium]